MVYSTKMEGEAACVVGCQENPQNIVTEFGRMCEKQFEGEFGKEQCYDLLFEVP